MGLTSLRRRMKKTAEWRWLEANRPTYPCRMIDHVDRPLVLRNEVSVDRLGVPYPLRRISNQLTIKLRDEFDRTPPGR
jgi:hypothetical protein